MEDGLRRRIFSLNIVFDSCDGCNVTDRQNDLFAQFLRQQFAGNFDGVTIGFDINAGCVEAKVCDLFFQRVSVRCLVAADADRLASVLDEIPETHTPYPSIGALCWQLRWRRRRNQDPFAAICGFKAIDLQPLHFIGKRPRTQRARQGFQDLNLTRNALRRATHTCFEVSYRGGAQGQRRHAVNRATHGHQRQKRRPAQA